MTAGNPSDNIAFEYIDTAEKLHCLTDALQSVDEVALDTEADSFHHYQPKICLIQITFNRKHFIIDPLVDLDLSGFLKSLAHKNLILHDAGYDLRLLFADFGFKPKAEVFDTMLGASLAGLKNVGLSAMLNLLFDKNPAKQNQKADWSKRPLSAKCLQYAAEDTAYLFEIKSYLLAELTQLNRMDWHVETCQWAVRAAYSQKDEPNPDRQWRIKGTAKCSPKKMAFIKQIWLWREEIARSTNIAPFMICRNEEMIKLALWAAHRKKAIEPETKLPIRCQSRYKKALLAALLTARDLPEDQWPDKVKSDRSKRLSDRTLKVVNELKTECETIAADLNLAPQLLASRMALTRIVLNKASTFEQIQKKRILMNWQANLLLPAIKKVLEQ